MYDLKLTEEEVMHLRQMVLQPGFEVLLKFLQLESLNAQGKALDYEEPDNSKRLILLDDARATKRVVKSLTHTLCNYRQLPTQKEAESFDPLSDLLGQPN